MMRTRAAVFFAADKGEAVPASALATSPFLFPENANFSERQAIQEKAGEYTGDRFFSQRPADYKTAVDLLAAGAGVKTVARLVGCSVNTVRAIRRREGFSVDTLREKTVRALAEFVADASERLRDEVNDLPAAALAVPLGIATEKLQLLSGGATARVEVLQVAPVDAFAAYIESLPAAEPAAIGLSAESAPQKGPPGAGESQASAGAFGGGDMPSPALPLSGGVSATHPATPSDRPPAIGTMPPGGEGVETLPPPPNLPTHSDERGSETKES
jgi:hypothetical protein